MWQMSSHNTAISSRTDLNRCVEFTVTIHRCRSRAVVLYPLTHTSNASLLCLCMIIHNRLEVAFSQSLIIFAVCIKGFTCHFSAAFPCSLVAMLCLPDWNCDVPIAYVYTSFILRSIFLALNMFMHWTYKGKEVKELPDWVAGFVYEITNTKNGR